MRRLCFPFIIILRFKFIQRLHYVLLIANGRTYDRKKIFYVESFYSFLNLVFMYPMEVISFSKSSIIEIVMLLLIILANFTLSVNQIIRYNGTLKVYRRNSNKEKRHQSCLLYVFSYVYLSMKV